jgi:steroid 5-alpha reductase family enzyme
VLFVHKYSGGWFLILQSLSLLVTLCLLQAWSTPNTPGISEAPVDLKHAGILLFLWGISGNFYHHYLLSKLRGEGYRENRIPKGGLFELVICPHYLLEIIGFLEISFISHPPKLDIWTFPKNAIRMSRKTEICTIVNQWFGSLSSSQISQ